MLLEPFRAGSPRAFAGCPIKDFTAEHATILRDRKCGFPEAANTRVKLLRGLFKWGHGKGGLNRNPARDVPKLKVEGDGYHS